MKSISFVTTLFLSISVFAQPSKRQKNTAPKMEVFATVDGAVGNIAFTHSGDAVYSYHPFFEPTIRVAKYNATTQKSEPFPNLEWNTPRSGDTETSPKTYFPSKITTDNLAEISI